MNNPHQNARTTVFSRALMVQRVKEGKKVAQVAAELGVSRRTVYKWLARYRSGGEAALANRSSRPGRSPRRLAVERVATISALRRRRKSSLEIAHLLSLPISSVTLELRRLGLNRLSRLEPKAPAARYEHQQPGEMIHLDIKKLGKIKGVGHRIHGDRSKRSRGAGWEFLHVCVDDHSRLAYSELLPDEKAATATCFLLRAAAWLRRHGVTVRRVMTDNGSAYNSHLFRAACQNLGARHIRTRPYTPKTNGKAERFIRTSLEQWAYKEAYESSQERAERLGPWLNHYNNQRPHTALDYKPPVSRLDAVNNVLANYI
jgi:transposase InsO family protein